MKLTVLFLLGAVTLAATLGAAPDKANARRYIKADDLVRSKLPFSSGVLVGNTLYLAGTIGLDPETGLPPDDLEQEIRLALDDIKETLKQAGMTMDDLVTVTVYCPDLSLYDRFNSVYRTYFTGDFPARAFIGSGPLLRGGHFEIQAIAVKR